MEKYSPDMPSEELEKIPKALLHKVYDKELLYYKFIKATIEYSYLPAELMITDRPFVVSVTMIYFLKDNKLPIGTILLGDEELVEMFPDNFWNIKI